MKIQSKNMCHYSLERNKIHINYLKLGNYQFIISSSKVILCSLFMYYWLKKQWFVLKLTFFCGHYHLKITRGLLASRIEQRPWAFLTLTLSRCLKIAEKVSFNIASEANCAYVMSVQKLIKNAKNGPFWRVFENLKLAVKQCYQTGQF